MQTPTRGLGGEASLSGQDVHTWQVTLWPGPDGEKRVFRKQDQLAPSPASSACNLSGVIEACWKGEPVIPISSPAACHNAEMWQERSRHPNRRSRDLSCHYAGSRAVFCLSQNLGETLQDLLPANTFTSSKNGSTCSQLLRRRGHMVLELKSGRREPHPPRKFIVLCPGLTYPHSSIHGSKSTFRSKSLAFLKPSTVYPPNTFNKPARAS